MGIEGPLLAEYLQTSVVCSMMVCYQVLKKIFEIRKFSPVRALTPKTGLLAVTPPPLRLVQYEYFLYFIGMVVLKIVLN